MNSFGSLGRSGVLGGSRQSHKIDDIAARTDRVLWYTLRPLLPKTGGYVIKVRDTVRRIICIYRRLLHDV